MILSKADFLTNLATLLPDNSSQLISPLDVRTIFTDLVDSVNSLGSEAGNISAPNVGSFDSRTTLVGDGAIAKRDLIGRSNDYNSAFGYYALNGNYDGVKNTAIGATALSCNLYGDHNVAVGFNALAGNTTGSGNVGIGNFALQSNQTGIFNIALGHGAGHYVGNSSYNFYVGAHEVDFDDICDPAINSGQLPLLFGDLKNKKLVIGNNVLHDYGTLQVSGGVSPTHNDAFTLGHYLYNWKGAHISSGIIYPDSGNLHFIKSDPNGVQTVVAVMDGNGKVGIGTETPSGDNGILTVAGNIVPNEDAIYALGQPGLRWDGFFNDIVVSGLATLNDVNYNTINECLYDCKTLHLATSGFCDPSTSGLTGGALCGYLSDGALDGAGFEVHSSGSTYTRDYRFIFREPDQSLTCLEVDSNYARSRWESNISIAVTDGLHIGTQRVHSPGKLSLVTESGCYGLFIRPLDDSSGNIAFLGAEDHLNAYAYKQSVNLVGPSGGSDYFATISTVNSGVSVGLDLATRISGDMVGFGLQNNDDLDTSTARFSLRTYDNTGLVLESVNVLRTDGKVGITDISRASGDAAIIPAALFNVQGDNSCSVRFSSSGLATSSLDIIGNGNARASGLQIVYNPQTRIIDFATINLLDNVGKEDAFISATSGGLVGIGLLRDGTTRRVTPFEPLVISHTVPNSGTVAINEQTLAPAATADFGKLYVKPRVATGQTQAIFFLDDAGNEFNLVKNSLEGEDGVYGDERGNTYAGTKSPAALPTVSAHHNTTLGHYALNSVTTGSGNVAIGSGVLRLLTTGVLNTVIGGGGLEVSTASSYNTIIGPKNLTATTAANGNIFLGYGNVETFASTVDNAIVIGTGISNTTDMDDYYLAIGFGSDPLITGSLGGGTRKFVVNSGSIDIASANDTQTMSMYPAYSGSRDVSVIDIIDGFNPLNVDGLVSVRFTNSIGQTRTLMNWDHSASGMTNIPSYVSSGDPRPFVQVEGDVRVRGAVSFADGTYIDSAGGLTVYGGTGIRKSELVYGDVLHLDYTNLAEASTLTTSVGTSDSYLALEVTEGMSHYVGKISLQGLSNYVGSGFASVANNCNLVFSDNENTIDTVNNSGTVFIGCGVGTAATGWKHGVIIGGEAGVDSTTPNVGLATDTPVVFIGYRAGRDSDNISNSIFIGTNAGYLATGAESSVFIGQSAGVSATNSDSIGIGQHALRGSTGSSEGGSGNIEIITGMLDNERLMYGQGTKSGRLNIQNAIAGFANHRRISIGDAILNPDAPLSARLDTSLVGHNGLDVIQTWYCNDTKVAQITCSGEFQHLSLPHIIEGFALSGIPYAAGYNSPSSGQIRTKNDSFLDAGDYYITNRDSTLTIVSGSFVVAHRLNQEYRPIWVSCSGAA